MITCKLWQAPLSAGQIAQFVALADVVFDGAGNTDKLRQHTWLRDNGYSTVETGADQANTAMLQLNLASGFVVVGTYSKEGGTDVILRKSLRD